MIDLTVIFLTANETPRDWQAFHWTHLRQAIGDYPLVTVSRVPMANPGVNLLDTDEKSYLNIYRQLLRGALAAQTPYVAVAEDDTLYSADHYRFHRPAPDVFAYNWHRWSLYTWYPNVYSLKMRKSNCSLIAPRDLLIAALEERFAKYPTLSDYKHWTHKFIGEVGRNVYERHLGLTPWKAEDVYSNVGIIQVSHPTGTEYALQQARTPGKSIKLLKRLGAVKATVIPHWGSAKEIASHYV